MFAVKRHGHGAVGNTLFQVTAQGQMHADSNESSSFAALSVAPWRFLEVTGVLFSVTTGDTGVCAEFHENCQSTCGSGFMKDEQNTAIKGAQKQQHDFVVMIAQSLSVRGLHECLKQLSLQGA